jgi:hypothetical protein
MHTRAQPLTHARFRLSGRQIRSERKAPTHLAAYSNTSFVGNINVPASLAFALDVAVGHARIEDQLLLAGPLQLLARQRKLHR